MKSLTNLEIIEKVARYQNSGYFYPLTCGNEECRGVLTVQEKDKKVILVCPSCGYVQEHIPEEILTTDYLIYELIDRILRNDNLRKSLLVILSHKPDFRKIIEREIERHLKKIYPRKKDADKWLRTYNKELRGVPQSLIKMNEEHAKEVLDYIEAVAIRGDIL